MAKRFTDTEKWKDEWYLSLNNDYRQIWLWLLDNCNHGGFCKQSLKLMNMMNNTSITKEELLEVFKDRIVEYYDYWFIPKFMFFQYGNNFLTSNQKAVKSAIKVMIDFGILQEDLNGELTFTIPLPNPYLTLTKPLPKGSLTLMDKDKDKDKEKEMDKGGKRSEFDIFQSYFPKGKNSTSHHEIAIWDTLGTRDRHICLQLTPLYIQHHLNKGNDKFIKNIKNFLSEGFWNEINQFQSRYLGKKVKLKENINTQPKKLNLTTEDELSMIDKL